MARGWLGAVAGATLVLWQASAPLAVAQPAPEGSPAAPAGQPIQPPAPPVAQQDFATFLDGVKAEAAARGIRAQTLEHSLADVAPIGRVLELDRKQPEFTLTFPQYLAHVVTPERVASGRGNLRRHKGVLAAVAKRYGVPARVIVAMWGIETNYGEKTGGFQVVPALATLAYDGRRSHYFRGELLNALQMVDQGVPVERMRGSWAGAMGQCQFMPSTYLKFAQNWGGTGMPDIWNSRSDVFASAANYLSQIGWNARQGWGRPVSLPKSGMAPQLFGLENRRSLREWAKLGLRQADGKPLPLRADIEASLIRAESGKEYDAGQGAPYLVYDNFRVLMKWNRSVFFALAAGTLADRIGSK